MVIRAGPARVRRGLTKSCSRTGERMRFIAGIVVIAALLGFGWVFSLPSKAECVASGRVVDPTERHCESADGYEQLQEHALFHSREVVLGTAIIVALGYAGVRFRRSRSAGNIRP